MATLTNSQRRTYKATYTPIGGLQLSPSPDAGVFIQRALDKSSYVGALMVHDTELTPLRAALSASGTGPGGDLQSALDCVEQLARDRLPGAVLRNAPGFAPINPQTLLEIGSALAFTRADRYQKFQGSLQGVRAAHIGWLRSRLVGTPDVAPSASGLPADYPPAVTRTEVAASSSLKARRAAGTSTRVRPEALIPAARATQALATTATVARSVPASTLIARDGATTGSRVVSPLLPTLADTLAWAAAFRTGDHRNLQQLALAVAARLYLLHARRTVQGIDIEALRQFSEYTQSATQGFADQFK